MNLSIVTPKGLVFDNQVDFIVVQGDEGQLAILENHVSIVVPIRNGFVKRVNGNEEVYHVVSGGLLEFSNNIATVIAQETVEGKTYDDALKALDELRLSIKEKNRKQTMDFTEMERELALNLKDIKASKI